MVLTVLLPIYGLVLCGFLAVRSGYFQAEHVPALGRYSLKLALPALVFLSLAGSQAKALNPAFLLGYGLAALTLSLLGWGLARFWLREAPGRSGMAALGSVCSNSGFIGYPLAMLVMPDLAGAVLAHTMLLENFFFIPLGMALARLGDRAAMAAFPGQFARDLLGNPLIMALALALLWRAGGLALPRTAEQILRMFGQSLAPVALFYLGATIATLPLSRNLALPALRISIFKLALHPAAAALGLWLAGVEGAMWQVGVLFAAVPMLAVFPIFSTAYGERDFAATSLLIAMLGGMASLAIVLSLLRF